MLEFQGKSRKYLKFRLDGKDGIKIQDDEICFPKWDFKTESDCRNVLAEVAMRDKFEPMKRIDKTFTDIHSKSLDMTTAIWNKMQKFMSNPEKFEKDDFRIFESWIANNVPDRDVERFPKKVLNSFKKSIVNKSVLTGHNWGPPGEGKVFQARVEKYTIDEAQELLGHIPHPKFDDILKFVNEKDGGIFFLVTTYYMLADNRELVRKIDSGIISHMSIGFRAPRRVSVDTEGNEEDVSYWFDAGDKEDILFVEFQNSKDTESEALEQSWVFLGAQYGAENRKNYDDFDALVKQAVRDEIAKSSNGARNVSESDFKLIDIEKIGNERISGVVKKIDELKSFEEVTQVYTENYINSLPDSCFAFVEPAKDNSKNARFFPHHKKDGAIDIVLLRNELARVGLKEVPDTFDKIILGDMEKHLLEHTREMGIDVEPELEVMMFEFKIESLDINYPINGEKLAEDLGAVVTKVTGKVKSLNETVENQTQIIETLKADNSTLTDEKKELESANGELSNFQKDVKKIFGEDVTADEMKRMKETADQYRNELLEKVLIRGQQAKIFTADDVDEKKKYFESMDNEHIAGWIKQYEEIFVAKNPKNGELLNNLDEKVTDPETEPKVVPQAVNRNAYIQ